VKVHIGVAKGRECDLVDVFEEVVGVASVERVDGPSEEVEVDNEGDSVGGGSEAACCHERPVEAVGAGEEALEGDGSGRRVRIIICVVEGRVGVVVRRGCRGVGSGGVVSGIGGGGLGGLGGLGDGSEGLHVGRGPPEEAPRHHGRPELAGARVTVVSRLRRREV
jgi:hypothetical protein